MINSSRAFEIASQWGSHVSAGDVGTCFTSLWLGDATPQTEGHREACIQYTLYLLTNAKLEPEDRSDLIALLYFFDQTHPVEGVTPSRPEKGPDPWAS